MSTCLAPALENTLRTRASHRRNHPVGEYMRALNRMFHLMVDWAVSRNESLIVWHDVLYHYDKTNMKNDNVSNTKFVFTFSATILAAAVCETKYAPVVLLLFLA